MSKIKVYEYEKVEKEVSLPYYFNESYRLHKVIEPSVLISVINRPQHTTIDITTDFDMPKRWSDLQDFKSSQDELKNEFESQYAQALKLLPTNTAPPHGQG